MTYIVEIRLAGENMTPEKISSRDIGALISSFEEMVASLVVRDNPALGLEEDQVIVGLAAIKQGSYVMQFHTEHDVPVENAVHIATNSISNEKYINLPFKAIESIKEIRKFTRKYRTTAEFWEQNGNRRQLATVSTNTKIEVEETIVRGKTTLYGTVIGIGGMDPPRVRIQLLDKSVIMNCNITRTNGLQIARRLGERLYQKVGVRGTASWDSRDMSLQHFLVEELTSYRETSIDDAVTSLRNAAGGYYDTIEDINAFLADMRGTGGEDLNEYSIS